jgi:Zn-dependent membrane protease YugP
MRPASHDPRHHPWWQHVPAERQQATLWRRRQRRLWQLLSSRRSQLLLLLGLLLVLTAGLAVAGAGGFSLALLLPLLLLPALAALSYWLTWREFHR